jgi:hypothetical protein
MDTSYKSQLMSNSSCEMTYRDTDYTAYYFRVAGVCVAPKDDL